VATGFPISVSPLSKEPVMLGVLPATEDIIGVANGGGVSAPPPFLLLGLEDPATPNVPPDYVVASYTAAGALRSGYPVVVGNESGGPVLIDHSMRAIAVNGTGTLYLVGEEPHATITGQRSLIIHRMAAQ